MHDLVNHRLLMYDVFFWNWIATTLTERTWYVRIESEKLGLLGLSSGVRHESILGSFSLQFSKTGPGKICEYRVLFSQSMWRLCWHLEEKVCPGLFKD